MRKIAAMLAAAVLGASLLAGCSAQPASTSASPATTSSSTSAASSSSSPVVNDAGVSSNASTASSVSSSSASASKAASASPKKVSASLRKKIDALMKKASVDATFEYVDLKTGATYGVGAGQQMVAASMIKLLVLATALDQADQGKLSLDDTYTLKSKDLVGGTGSLQARGAGATVTLREAAKLMISESDNVAANIFIDKLGKKAINAEATKLGLSGTQLDRRMMQENGSQNYMTADDAAIILKRIYDGKLGNEELSSFALDALKAQTDKTGFAQGLSGATFAHKTGQLSDPAVQNDGGIVLDDDPYILVAFTEGSNTNGAALMQSLAQTISAAR
jgi:beta-lactamase class A